MKPFQLYLRVYRLAFGPFLNSTIQITLEIYPMGIHCAVCVCGGNRNNNVGCRGLELLDLDE